MKPLHLPKISVITIVRNGVKTIEKTIKSVLEQNYNNLEYIIIDGLSTDGTLEIIKKYDLHITYWSSEVDKSAGEAMLKGIKKATGTIICFLNADDWYELDTLPKVGKAFNEYPDLDIVTCAGRIVKFDTKKNAYTTTLLFSTSQELDLSFHNICFGVSAISCRFIQTKFIEKIGLPIPYDENNEHMYTNDKEFLLRASLNQAKNLFIEHLGHTCLAHDGSSTFGHHVPIMKRMLREHIMIAEKFLRIDNINKENQRLLIHWHKDQSIRLLFREIFTGNFKEASKIAFLGIKKHHIFWLYTLLVTPSKVIFMKAFNFFFKKEYVTCVHSS